MTKTSYAGIDYSLGRSNVDRSTGIHYGVIHANDVGQAWYDSSESDYGDPTCPQCGGKVVEPPADYDDYTVFHTYPCDDYVCEACKTVYGNDDVYGEDPIGFTFEDSEYSLQQSDDDSDIFVLRSPYYTRAQYCSPCAPGAGYLMNPCPDGPKTYCLGPEWFEDEVAPYPVYRVSDDSEVVS